ncbi:MAG: tetratricopeptide repeat protein [Desulfobacterales bacterium]|nr:tetratricopeptide repeat protein [Desulfobacterales bacterium]
MKNPPLKNFFLSKQRDLLICLFLILSTLAVYWQVKDYKFVYYDDNKYVSENPHVLNGLTVESIIWAFTTKQSSNWHPVTWLSHMLDIQLFGPNPGRHHQTNLFFHILNALLIFAVFSKMTGMPWQSGVVAALFALHPLHVESVAWIAERKDVLSTFFGMLALWGYVRYAARPNVHRYLLVFLFLALGLMSKPMLVTFPFVFLLLDYWPLNRFAIAACPLPENSGQRHIFLRLVREKLPLFLLIAISSIITYLVQQQSGSLRPLDAVPIGVRAANALTSYVKYIGKMFWPADLAVLYPYPSAFIWWKVAGAFFFLSTISVFAVWTVKRRPYVAVGWFWFLGTLVPVIGLAQVGIQAMADRYTYIPLIGIFIIIVWSASELVVKFPRIKIMLTAVTATILLLLMAATIKQVRYWQNTVTLFEHTLAVTDNNWLPHYNLGFALDRQGQTEAAVTHYQEALRIKPDYEQAHNNLGLALEKLGRYDQALRHYSAALRINPNFEKTHNNLGLTLEKLGRTDEAITHYREALRINPNYENALNNLGFALEKRGRTDEAITHYREALRINPNYERAHYNLANALHRSGRIDEAVVHYLEAVRIKPDYEAAHNNLGIALFQKGNIDGAVREFREALRINPESANAKNNLMRVLAVQRERP